MNTAAEMPARIRELWTDWYPDDRKWLEDFREALRSGYDKAVRRAVLFGSKARGDSNEDSDIDVLVIVDDKAAATKEELIDVGARLSATSMAMPSVLPLTEAEWARLGGARANLYSEVEQQGVSLF